MLQDLAGNVAVVAAAAGPAAVAVEAVAAAAGLAAVAVEAVAVLLAVDMHTPAVGIG